MKNLIIIFTVVIFSASAFAQFTAGEIGIGGAISLNSNSSKISDGDESVHDNSADNTFGFRFIPRVQYFINDQFSIGGRVGIDFYNDKSYQLNLLGDEVKLKDTWIGVVVGPVANYYWGVGEKKKAGFYAEAGLSYTYWTGKDEELVFPNNVIAIKKDKMHQLSLGVLPGVFYRPTDCIYFDFALEGFRFHYDFSVTRDQGSDIRYRRNSLRVGGDTDFLQRLTDITIGATLLF